MLAPVPPWESINPLDFVNAAASGARLGLERAGQTLSANEAADQLGLHYAQLASENARASMAGAAAQRNAAASEALRRIELENSMNQWMQEMGLKKQQADAIDKYREGSLANRDLLTTLALNKAAGLGPKKGPPNVGNIDLGGGKSVPYLWSPDTGTFQMIHPSLLTTAKGGAISPLQRVQIKQWSDEYKALQKKYADTLSVAAAERLNPELKAQHDQDLKRIATLKSSIEQILGGSAAQSATTSAADDLMTPDDEGSLLSPPPTGSSNPADPLGILDPNQ